MVGKLGGEGLMGRVILGDNQKAACVFIKPVDDAGALHAPNAGEAFATMGDQGVDQRAGFIARAGMDHKPGGLINHDEVIIFIDDG